MDTFTFVRCPVSRLISAYLYCRNRGTPAVPQSIFTRPPSSSLRNFEVFCRDWLFSQEYGNIDFVLKPQSAWILDYNNSLIVDTIIDISHADSFLAKFMVLRQITRRSSAQFLCRNSVGNALRQQIMSKLPRSLIDDIKTYYDIDYKVLSGLFLETC